MIHYFIKNGDAESGPFSLQQLKSMPIDKDTMIWHAGVKEWCKAESHYELKILFQKKLSLHAFAAFKLKKVLRISSIKHPLKKVS
jgi:hypothetical protein